MKNAIRIVLVVAIVLVFVGVADAAVVKVKVQTANIRRQPDATAPVITQAVLGTMFEATRKVGNWWEIAVADASGNSVTGYINADIVDEVGAAPAAGQPQAQPQYQPQPAAPQSYAPPGSYGASSGGKFLIMVGPVLSDLALSDSLGSGVTKSMRFGFAGGAGYEAPLGKDLALQFAVFFSTGGANFTMGSDKAAYVANALAVPLLFKFNFGGPFISVGPYAGLIMSPKYTYTQGGTSGEQTISTSDINTFMYGLLLGGGFEFDLGGMKGFLQLAYQLGLANISKDTTSTIKPTSINIIFGFKL